MEIIRKVTLLKQLMTQRDQLTDSYLKLGLVLGSCQHQRRGATTGKDGEQYQIQLYCLILYNFTSIHSLLIDQYPMSTVP